MRLAVKRLQAPGSFSDMGSFLGGVDADFFAFLKEKDPENRDETRERLLIFSTESTDFFRGFDLNKKLTGASASPRAEWSKPIFDVEAQQAELVSAHVGPCTRVGNKPVT